MTKPYYEDDYVTLYHGDCLSVDAWLAADVLVTDPPYGVAYTSGWVEGRARNSTGIAGDRSPTIRNAAIERWGERPYVAFGSWRVPKPEKVRNTLIWSKGDDPGTGDLTMPWGASYEEIYISGSGPIWGGSRRSSVLSFQKPIGADRPNHPSPKPVGLMEHLVERCPPGVIADPFAGSGATLLAARNLGRRVIGVELEEKYCELIVSRLSQQAFDFTALEPRSPELRSSGWPQHDSEDGLFREWAP